MGKIFISHSSKDKEYAEEMVQLLIGMGIKIESILCTSVAGAGLELGAPDFLRSIKDELIESPLFICLFSKNYLKSPICLCEMGAAWITSKEQVLILTPDMSFVEVTNIVLGRSQGMKINDFDKILEFIEKYKAKELKVTEILRLQRRFLNEIERVFTIKKSEVEIEEKEDNILEKEAMTVDLDRVTIEYLKDYITGDSGKVKYMSGPNLIDFFNSFGSEDSYGQGFPSRWLYAQTSLLKFNGKKEMKYIIEKITDKRNFIGTDFDYDLVIKELNEILSYDKYLLKNINGIYKIFELF